MGVFLRSAIVIGVLVYLSPLRTESPAGERASGHAHSSPALSGAVLSDTADRLWQSLPETARKAVIDKAKRQILNEVRNGLLTEENHPPQEVAPPQETSQSAPQNARKHH